MKSKRIIVLLLCVVFAFATIFSGCSKEDSTTFRTPLTVDNLQNHVRSVSETDKYVIQNGQTEYKIVIPVNADAQTKMAAEELFALTREASQVILRTITDDQIAEGEDR